MILISHRGNMNGKRPDFENTPCYINRALDAGYDCEIDVWNIDQSWWLGHDEPEYHVHSSFLMKKGLWIHAKNVDALEKLVATKLNFFWHQKDDYTITSHNYIWAYPQMPAEGRAICVLPKHDHEAEGFAGICSDQIAEFEHGC